MVSFAGRFLPVLFFGLALLPTESSLGQDLPLDKRQVPEFLECAEVHIESGQEQRLFCVPEEADASWTYRWQSERPAALGFLSSTVESRPVLRIPQNAAPGLYTYRLTVEDTRGRVLHTGRQEVVVHAAGFCGTDGPAKGLGQTSLLCEEPEDKEVLAAGQELEVQLTDGGIGDAGAALELDCEPHSRAETGSEASIACHGHGAGMLEYTAEFDWPPFVQTQVLGEGPFTLTIRPPKIDTELETRPVRVTARDLSAGRSATKEIALTVVNVEPVLECDDLEAVTGERVTVQCRAASAEGLPVHLQLLPRQRLDGVPEGVFEEGPEFVAPLVAADTTVEIVVRAIESETNRVAEASFVLRIAPQAASDPAIAVTGPSTGGAGYGTAADSDPLSVSCTNVTVTENTVHTLTNCLITGGSAARRPYTYAWTGSTYLANTNRLLARFDATDIDVAEMGSTAYTIILTVTDPTAGKDISASDSFTLTVVDAPNINASCDEGGYEPEEASEDFDFECNPGGSLYTWEWSPTDRLTDHDTATPTFDVPDNLPENATYRYTGTVKRGGHDDGTVSVSVTVEDRGTADDITVTCSGAPYMIVEGESVEFDCSASVTGEDPVSFNWSWNPSNGLEKDDVANPTYQTAVQAGHQTVDRAFTGTVTDTNNNFDAGEIGVTVTVKHKELDFGCGNGNHTVNEGHTGLSVGCTATANDNGSPNITYEWTDLDGNNGADHLASTSAGSTTFNAPYVSSNTTYQMRLTATDSSTDPEYESDAIDVTVAVRNVRQQISVNCHSAMYTGYEGGSSIELSPNPCTASAADGSVPTYQWSWSSDDLTINSANTATPVIVMPSGLTADTPYSITATASAGTGYIAGSNGVTVRVLNRVLDLNCDDEEITVDEGDSNFTVGCSATANTGSPTIAYSWTGDTDELEGSGAIRTFDVPGDVEETTTYEMTLTATATDYDSDAIDVDVTVQNLVGISVTCMPDDYDVYEASADIEFSCTAEADDGSTPTFMWSWSSGLTDDKTATPEFDVPNNVDSDTDYQFTVWVKAGDGYYPGETTVDVKVRNRVLSLSCGSANPSVLEGSADFRLNCGPATANTGSPGIMYAWSGDTAILKNPSATIRNPEVDVPGNLASTRTYNLTLEATATGYESATARVAVKVRDRPDISASCTGSPYTVDEGDDDFAFSCTPAGTGYTWSWTPSGKLSSAAVASPTFQVPDEVTATTTYEYSATVTRAGYDNGAASVSVTVQNVMKQLTISCSGGTDKTVDEGSDDLELSCWGEYPSTGPEPANTTYAWTSDDAAALALLSSTTSKTTTFQVPDEVVGDKTYEYTITATSPGHKNGSTDVSVTVRDAVPLSVSCESASAYEGGDDVSLACTALGTPSGTKYAWTARGSTTGTTPLSATNVLKPQFDVPASVDGDKAYEYRITVTAEGVSVTADVTVTVLEKPDIAVSCTAAKNVLEGQTAAFSCSASGAPGTPTYAWEWSATSSSDGTSHLQYLDPTNTATPTFTAPSLDEDVDVSMTFTATATAGNADAGTSDVALTVRYLRVINLACDPATYAPVEGTQDVELACSVTDPPAGTTYSWAASGSTPNTDLLTRTDIANPSFQVPDNLKASATYTYKLTASAPYAEDVRKAVTVTVKDRPDIVAQCEDVDVQEGAADVTLDCSASGLAAGTTYGWSWTPAESLGQTNVEDPVFMVPASVTKDSVITYTATVTATGGDPATEMVTVTVRNIFVLSLSCDPSTYSVQESSQDITLDCAASGGPEDAVYNYAWQAVAPTADTDLLVATDVAGPTFQVPDNLDANATYTYQLTAGSVNASNEPTQTVAVTVTDRPDVSLACLVRVDGSSQTGLPETVYEGEEDLSIECSDDPLATGPSATAWTWAAPTASHLSLLAGTGNNATRTFQVPEALEATQTYVYRITGTASDADPTTVEVSFMIHDRPDLALNCDTDLVAYVGEDDKSVGCAATSASTEVLTAVPSYAWQAVAPTANTDLLSATNVASPTFSVPDVATGAGTYHYRVVAMAAGWDPVQADFTVTVHKDRQVVVTCPAIADVYEEAAAFNLGCSASGAADGASYTWSWDESKAPRDQLTETETASPLFTVPAVTADEAYAYEATVTATGALDGTATVSFSVLERPDISVSCTEPTESLKEGRVNLELPCTATGAPGEGAYAWTWQRADGTGDLTATDIANPEFVVPDVSAATDFVYTVTATAANADAGTNAVTVTVLDEPMIPLTCSTTEYEAYAGGTAVQVDCSMTLEPAGVSYAWQAVGTSEVGWLSSSSVVNPAVTLPADATAEERYGFELVVEATDAFAVRQHVYVTARQKPTIAVTCESVDDVREGSAAFRLDCGASGAPGEAPAYAWDWGANPAGLTETESGAPLFTPPASVAADTEYSFTATVSATNAASGTATVSFSVLDAATVIVACTKPSESLREGRMPLELPCAVTGTDATPPYTWLWERAAGTSDLSATNVASPTFTVPDVSATTDFTYTVTATPASGSAITTTVTVTVVDEPMIPLECTSFDYAAYEGGAGVEVGCSVSREVPGLAVQWLAGGSPADLALVSPRTALNPLLTPPSSVEADETHRYTVIVSATNAYSLVRVMTFTVKERPDIAVTCESVDDVQEDAAAFRLDCSADGAPGESPVYTWDWGSAPAELTEADSGTPLFTPANVDADTEYRLSVTVTAADADAGTATVTFDVLDRTDITVTCDGPSESLREGRMPLAIPCTATGSPGSGPYTWLWERAEGTGALSATNVASPTFTAPDVTASTDFTYTVTAAADDADAGKATVTVTVLDEPMIPLECTSFDYEAYEGGSAVEVDCSLSREVPGLTVQWLAGGSPADLSLVSSRTVVDPDLTPPSSVTSDVVHKYTVILSATNAYSQVRSFTFTVKEKPDITVTCQSVNDVQEGSAGFRLDCSAEGAPGESPVYTWDWGETPAGLTEADDGAPLFTPPASVDADTEYSFTATVTADNADSGTATVTFSVLDS